MSGRKRIVQEIELDLGRYELRRGGRRVRLEKKPMDLLIFLVSRREQLVSRRDIVTRLWRTDLFIDAEASINNIVRKIRTALGDNSDHPRFLETIVGMGYRFIGPVRVIDARFEQSGATQHPIGEVRRERAQALRERTTLAVLPLLPLGNIPDDRGISFGFADALVTRLGNLPGVDVLPTSASLNLPADLTAADAAARLGVRFVVHGGIQESKEQWRLSLEMFDAQLQSVILQRKCDLDLERLFELHDELSRQIAAALHRPLQPVAIAQRARYSKDPLAYTEFMRGYRLSAAGDPALLDEAAQRLSTAVARDPRFSLAHATLSLVSATRHFEFDPTSTWLEKAEFHCARALDLDPDLAEGHLAKAFLLWGPSKNFQHLEAIAELRRALSLQSNLPQAYNRLGTILAHIGLFDHAREMYERGRSFHPGKKISHSIAQVYLWNREYDRAREEIAAWRAESPGNKYPVYCAPQPAMMTGEWKEAETLLEDALQLLPEEPMIVSLHGLFFALTGEEERALACLSRACANPRSFGHAHHSYYQIACILAVLKQPKPALEWLERSVSTGFACWPLFMNDPCLENLRGLAEFEGMVSALQARYPEHLGIL